MSPEEGDAEAAPSGCDEQEAPYKLPDSDEEARASSTDGSPYTAMSPEEGDAEAAPSDCDEQEAPYKFPDSDEEARASSTDGSPCTTMSPEEGDAAADAEAAPSNSDEQEAPYKFPDSDAEARLATQKQQRETRRGIVSGPPPLPFQMSPSQQRPPPERTCDSASSIDGSSCTGSGNAKKRAAMSPENARPASKRTCDSASSTDGSSFTGLAGASTSTSGHVSCNSTEVSLLTPGTFVAMGEETTSKVRRLRVAMGEETTHLTKVMLARVTWLIECAKDEGQTPPPAVRKLSSSRETQGEVTTLQRTVSEALSQGAAVKLPPTHTTYAYQKAAKIIQDKVAHRHLHLFFQRLREKGITMVAEKVASDGNCILLACSLSIWGTTIFAPALRCAMRKEIDGNESWYQRTLGKSKHGVREMAQQAGQDKIFLDTVQFLVLANTIRRPVLVYNSDEGTKSYGLGCLDGAAGSFWPSRLESAQLVTTHPVTLAWGSRSHDHIVPLIFKHPGDSGEMGPFLCPLPWESLNTTWLYNRPCLVGLDGFGGSDARLWSSEFAAHGHHIGQTLPRLICQKWVASTLRLIREAHAADVAVAQVAVSTEILPKCCVRLTAKYKEAIDAVSHQLSEVACSGEHVEQTRTRAIVYAEETTVCANEILWPRVVDVANSNTRFDPRLGCLVAARDLVVGAIVAAYVQPVRTPAPHVRQLGLRADQKPLLMYLEGKPWVVYDKVWTDATHHIPNWNRMLGVAPSEANARCLACPGPGVWWVATVEVRCGQPLKIEDGWPYNGRGEYETTGAHGPPVGVWCNSEQQAEYASAFLAEVRSTTKSNSSSKHGPMKVIHSQRHCADVLANKVRRTAPSWYTVNALVDGSWTCTHQKNVWNHVDKASVVAQETKAFHHFDGMRGLVEFLLQHRQLSTVMVQLMRNKGGEEFIATYDTSYTKKVTGTHVGLFNLLYDHGHAVDLKLLHLLAKQAANFRRTKDPGLDKLREELDATKVPMAPEPSPEPSPERSTTMLLTRDACRKRVTQLQMKDRNPAGPLQGRSEFLIDDEARIDSEVSRLAQVISSCNTTAPWLVLEHSVARNDHEPHPNSTDACWAKGVHAQWVTDERPSLSLEMLVDTVVLVQLKCSCDIPSTAQHQGYGISGLRYNAHRIIPHGDVTDFAGEAARLGITTVALPAEHDNIERKTLRGANEQPIDFELLNVLPRYLSVEEESKFMASELIQLSQGSVPRAMRSQHVCTGVKNSQAMDEYGLPKPCLEQWQKGLTKENCAHFRTAVQKLALMARIPACERTQLTTKCMAEVLHVDPHETLPYALPEGITVALYILSRSDGVAVDDKLLNHFDMKNDSRVGFDYTVALSYSGSCVLVGVTYTYRIVWLAYSRNVCGLYMDRRALQKSTLSGGNPGNTLLTHARTHTHTHTHHAY